MHTRSDEMRYAMCKNTSLARPCTGNDEQWSTCVLNSITLVGIELRQVEGDAVIVVHFAYEAT